MLLAVISDIHGNLEALEKVLEDMDLFRPDRVISLGDNVGYGPNPEEVLHILRERGIPSIMGNHELAIADPSCLAWFNASARRSIEITRSLLSPESIEYIGTLGTTLREGLSLFVHGFPPDLVTAYLFEKSAADVEDWFRAMQEDACFIGHTHELALVYFDGARARHVPLAEGVTELPEGRKIIVNAGSVGQPRDGDNRAKYVLWDDLSRTLRVRCLHYDMVRTARKILDLGFPEINARRLY